jgi:predicted RNA polymerase sigma factor
VSRSPGIEGLLRDAAPRALGVVVRRFGDFAGCEDAVQEALIEAAEQWPLRGTPESPVGWLIHVASRRMTDRIRSEQARRRRETEAALLELPDPEPSPEADDALALIFLVPEATMAQRISRAKQSVKAVGASFAMPDGEERTERLRSVLHVLYLIFNEGYLSSAGPELARGELSGEAIRLTRTVRLALPDDPEVAGLLALMLLTEARRPARADANDVLIPLAEQDRTLWDQGLIAEGVALIGGAWSKGSIGEYQLQAAIAAVHDQAARAEDTDWREILALYGLLERMTQNPMVTLNRAIAATMVEGPEAGLELLEPLEGSLFGHHRLHATRAHLLEIGGETEAAIGEYEAAANRTASLPEQRYLLTQAARLRESLKEIS